MDFKHPLQPSGFESYEMAQFCLKHPEIDYGIHLTLTGEWKNYPFRAISPTNQIQSLVNSHGYFYPKRASIRDSAVLDEVYLELKNQIEFALRFSYWDHQL